LRVHTTNDNTGSLLIEEATRNSAEQCSVVLPGIPQDTVLVRMINLSQIVAAFCAPRRSPRQKRPVNRTGLALQIHPKAHPLCPNRYHHGIDFKNPFTMSKRKPSGFRTAVSPRRISCLHLSGNVERGAL